MDEQRHDAVGRFEIGHQPHRLAMAAPARQLAGIEREELARTKRTA